MLLRRVESAFKNLAKMHNYFEKQIIEKAQGGDIKVWEVV